MHLYAKVLLVYAQPPFIEKFPKKTLKHNARILIIPNFAPYNNDTVGIGQRKIGTQFELTIPTK